MKITIICSGYSEIKIFHFPFCTQKKNQRLENTNFTFHVTFTRVTKTRFSQFAALPHTQNNHPSMTILLPASNRLSPRLFKLDRKPVCTTPNRSTYFPNEFLIILYGSTAKFIFVIQNYYNDSVYLGKWKVTC
jgi:hypothetical protein